MSYCKHCGNEVSQGASYCSKCGNYSGNQGSNIGKMIGGVARGFINPSAYIRSSRISDIMCTSILLGLILLIHIVKQVIFKSNYYCDFIKVYSSSTMLEIILGIISIILFIGLSATIIFAILKTKNITVNFMETINVQVYAYFFVFIFMLVVHFFFLLDLNKLGIFFSYIIKLIYLLIVYHGVRSIWKLNPRITFGIISLQYIGMIIIEKLISYLS